MVLLSGISNTLTSTARNCQKLKKKGSLSADKFRSPLDANRSDEFRRIKSRPGATLNYHIETPASGWRANAINDLFRILSGRAQRSLPRQLMISLKVLSRLE